MINVTHTSVKKTPESREGPEEFIELRDSRIEEEPLDETKPLRERVCGILEGVLISALGIYKKVGLLYWLPSKKERGISQTVYGTPKKPDQLKDIGRLKKKNTFRSALANVVFYCSRICGIFGTTSKRRSVSLMWTMLAFKFMSFALGQQLISILYQSVCKYTMIGVQHTYFKEAFSMGFSIGYLYTLENYFILEESETSKVGEGPQAVKEIYKYKRNNLQNLLLYIGPLVLEKLMHYDNLYLRFIRYIFGIDYKSQTSLLYRFMFRFTRTSNPNRFKRNVIACYNFLFRFQKTAPNNLIFSFQKTDLFYKTYYLSLCICRDQSKIFFIFGTLLNLFYTSISTYISGQFNLYYLVLEVINFKLVFVYLVDALTQLALQEGSKRIMADLVKKNEKTPSMPFSRVPPCWV